MNTNVYDSNHQQNKNITPKFYRKNNCKNEIYDYFDNYIINGHNFFDNNKSFLHYPTNMPQQMYINPPSQTPINMPQQMYINPPSQTPINMPQQMYINPTSQTPINMPQQMYINPTMPLYTNSLLNSATPNKHNNKIANKNTKTYKISLSPLDSLKFIDALNEHENLNTKKSNMNCDDFSDKKCIDDFLLNILKNLNNQTLEKIPEKKMANKIPKKYDDIDVIYNELDVKCNTLLDLINLGKKYDPNKKNNYAFDYEKLYNIVEPLEELNSVIGMENVKSSIINQIMYFLLDLEPVKDMLHTVIQGPPGVGKTMLGQILSKIYHKMEIIDGCNPNNMKFKIYKRTDFIGQYLGHTAIKTQKAIDECMGGVMFIDEAYSLGSPQNSEKSDIYSKECLDTLMQNLSERAGKFVVIIAGYGDELDKNFFGTNSGLRRRFTFKYSIDKYDHNELMRIFDKKVINSNWKFNDDLDDKTKSEFIKKHYKEFTHYAGDMETLLFHVKVAHGIRIFGKNPFERKKINMDDITRGFELFKKCKNENKQEPSQAFLSMFN
jgi:hypothetical protein